MKQVFFWKEVLFGEGEILAVPATLLGPSEQICSVCKEPPTNHDRRHRKHAFTPMSDPGVTLEIHYWTDAEGQPVVSNVQYGRQANCYTNTEQE